MIPSFPALSSFTGGGSLDSSSSAKGGTINAPVTIGAGPFGSGGNNVWAVAIIAAAIVAVFALRRGK